MQATVSIGQDRAVIKLRGRFDFKTHRDFRQVIDTVFADPPAGIVIDFDDVDYVDSAGLGMLLMLRDRAKQAAREVKLANCRGAVSQTLKIASFGKLFEID